VTEKTPGTRRAKTAPQRPRDDLLGEGMPLGRPQGLTPKASRRVALLGRLSQAKALYAQVCTQIHQARQFKQSMTPGGSSTPKAPKTQKKARAVLRAA
jgi:hypothetical protein